MPLQRRLPKFGFTSRVAVKSAQVRLHELNKIEGDVVDLLALKKAGLIKQHVETVKVIASGEISKAVNIKSVKVTAGAKAAIEAAGGSVE